jgi:ribosomal protein L37AE/L43A
MRVTMLSGHTCPNCDSYTVAQANGKSEQCPSCLTVVTRYRNVKLVQPGTMQKELGLR